MLNNPIFYKDFYKVDHISQYPKGTELIFSNFTPRKSRVPGGNGSVFFGLQYLMINYLRDKFNQSFFKQPKEMVMADYKKVMKETLDIDGEWQHIAALHDLGYLPIAIYALDEGTFVPEKVPALVIYNTLPEFYWVTNMLETLISTVLWGACTSATTARRYRLILDKYATETSDNPGFVDCQAHDFSMRGMFGIEAGCISGAAHLNYFKGTDCIPAILFSNLYYDKPLSCGSSVPASEHSVTCAGEEKNEFETYKRLITEVYPNGMISLVMDSWDFWRVIDDFLPRLKDEIMKRDGKLICRPDSGVPQDIICGTHGPLRPPVHEVSSEYATQIKGLIERLWDIFGGTVNSKGFKELDPHIGAIYGDSITPEIAEEICERLKAKGFASTNIVFGIGSYSYQHVTRDTYGWAMKATYAEIDEEGVNIFKDPKTDNGIKKSAKGILKVIKNDAGELELQQEVSWGSFLQDDNQLKLRFLNGEIK